MTRAKIVLSLLLAIAMLIRVPGQLCRAQPPTGEVRVETEHAVFYGLDEISSERTQYIARMFEEQVYPLLAEVLGMDPPDRPDIKLVRNPETYYDEILAATGSQETAEFQHWSRAWYMPGYGIVVRDLFSDDELWTTLAKQYVSYLLDGSGCRLPSWVREGLVWYLSLRGQDPEGDDVETRSDRYITEELAHDAYQQGCAYPLEMTLDEGSEPGWYLVFLVQAQAAVQHMVALFGPERVKQFLHLTRDMEPEEAFRRAFGVPSRAFHHWHRTRLQEEATREPEWNAITLRLPEGVSGYLLVFPPGETTSRDYLFGGGEAVTIKLGNDGSFSLNLEPGNRREESPYPAYPEEEQQYLLICYHADRPVALFGEELGEIDEVRWYFTRSCGRECWLLTEFLMGGAERLYGVCGADLPGGPELLEVKTKFK